MANGDSHIPQPRRNKADAALILVALSLLSSCGGDSTRPADDPSPSDTTGIPAEATTWLNANAIPLAGTSPSLSHGDLQFLKDVVGNARVVALGENTHGTRDFFEMKARILRFLVEEMGFDAFAIEATWPESYRVDHYLHTGEGDPAVLLSGLYFWTWNTESVLNMIRWMRAHNETGGSVSFHGFDMQFPGMALYNVRAYIARVDPDAAPGIDDLLACMTSYANGPNGRSPSPGYRNLTAEYRRACRASLDLVLTHLANHRVEYETASGTDAFEHARQSLRVALQFDMWASGEQSRDKSMAENTLWLVDRLGPARKLVLWAHNYHVSTRPFAQGSWLREALGDALLTIGFTHERGSFTATRMQGSSYLELGEHVLDPLRTYSYEHYFSTTATRHFVLDLRNRDLTTHASSWLAGPRLSRGIGCCYDPDRPSNYWYELSLPDAYDVVIHIRNTRATTVLPMQYPMSF